MLVVLQIIFTILGCISAAGYGKMMYDATKPPPRLKADKQQTP